jgi:hypothetical protein
MCAYVVVIDKLYTTPFLAQELGLLLHNAYPILMEAMKHISYNRKLQFYLRKIILWDKIAISHSILDISGPLP